MAIMVKHRDPQQRLRQTSQPKVISCASQKIDAYIWLLAAALKNTLCPASTFLQEAYIDHYVAIVVISEVWLVGDAGDTQLHE